MVEFGDGRKTSEVAERIGDASRSSFVVGGVSLKWQSAIKNQDASTTTTITGGGAFGATDKVLQHNGAGTMSMSGFTVDTFGKLYRAYGNCASSYERHVIMDDITASSGDILAGINSNFGDTAIITNSLLTSVDSVCTTFEGVASGSEPMTLTENEANAYCIYGSDVTSA